MEIRSSLLIIAFIFLNISYSQTSPFQGTWKWENGNNILYVYIISKTVESNNDKVLRVDYKMVEVQNGTETEIYSSKIDDIYFGAGALLSEGINESRGTIWDRTHPDTTDMYEGRIFLRRVPNSTNTLHWELMPPIDGIRGVSTSNPPTDFNLPKDIVLTRVIGGVQNGG